MGDERVSLAVKQHGSLQDVEMFGGVLLSVRRESTNCGRAEARILISTRQVTWLWLLLSHLQKEINRDIPCWAVGRVV